MTFLIYFNVFNVIDSILKRNKLKNNECYNWITFGWNIIKE